jgi:DNA-binding transcriptional ArsR family regulator
MEVFAALADPTRAKIIEVLALRDMTAGQIAARFPVSRPAVSRHLSVLRKARLVRARGEAQRRIYSLDPTGFNEADRWLTRCRDLWSKRLDALGHHLDKIAAKKRNRGRTLQ